MTHRAWGVVAGLAADQHGVVALAQLAARGVPEPTVGGWVARGRLIRLYAGVYAVGHRHLRAEGHYLAGVLACGPGAVLSHVSAAAHWGIRPSAASQLDVTSPIRTGRRKSGIRVHRGDRLQRDEVTAESGVPCTTVARTLLDLGSVRPAWVVASAVEAAERLGLFDVRATTVLLARHRGRRGAGRLRAAVSSFDEEALRARSETEARLFHLCVDRGLPRPLVNRVIDARGERFEVDLHWPAARVVVEVDSPFHDTVEAQERDAHRDTVLERAGWVVIRCRWADIVVNPDPLIARLRRLTIHDGSVSMHS